MDRAFKPKILVFASSAFPRWKGDASPAFVYDLSKRLNQRGCAVVVLAPHCPNAKGFEKLDGMDVHRFRYFLPTGLERLCYGGGMLPNLKKSFLAKVQLPFFFFAELFALWKLASIEKPDAIHAHWILPQGFAAAIVSKILGIPFVVTAHAGDVFPLKNFVFRTLSRFTVNSAAAVTVNSTYTMAAVEKVSGRKGIGIIPMGVDLRLFSSASSSAAAAVRRKCGISQKNGKMLLFVGRLAEKKGVTYLVAAMKNIIAKYPGCRLVVVGEGPEKAALVRQSQQLGLFESVVFAGSIPNTDLPSFYKAADVFVLPSIIDSKGDTEGLGVVLLEAIAAQTPVVASNVGGIPDIVIRNKTGLLVGQRNPAALAAAVDSLLRNSVLRRKLSAAAIVHIAKTFSWEKIAAGFAEVYGSIISKPRS